MEGDSPLNKPSGYRATFDFKSLNEIITDVGKLSLPTISEVEMSVRNCLVSTMDLKNQFFSIEIEPEDRPKTNFYWQNEVWQHKRLAQGLSISPYIAARAMHMTFSEEVLLDFLKKHNIVDFPFTKFNEFMILMIASVLHQKI